MGSTIVPPKTYDDLKSELKILSITFEEAARALEKLGRNYVGDILVARVKWKNNTINQLEGLLRELTRFKRTPDRVREWVGYWYETDYTGQRGEPVNQWVNPDYESELEEQRNLEHSEGEIKHLIQLIESCEYPHIKQQ